MSRLTNPCKPVYTLPDYSIQDCPPKSPCEHLLDFHCVIYNGPALPFLGIFPGDRMDEVMAKINFAFTLTN